MGIYDRDGVTVRHLDDGTIEGRFDRWDGYSFVVFVHPTDNFDPVSAALYLAGVASPLEYIWSDPLPQLCGFAGPGSFNMVSVTWQPPAKVIGLRRDDSYRQFGEPFPPTTESNQ